MGKYFDSKVEDYFSSYGKVVGLPKSCACGVVIITEAYPNLVPHCLVCGTFFHPVYARRVYGRLGTP